MTLTLQQLAQRLNARIVGNDEASISACAPIEFAGPTDVTFLANPKYARYLTTTRAGAVIVDARTACPEGLSRLIVDDPYFAFRTAMIELHGFRVHPRPDKPTDFATACISPDAAIHPTARIGENCTIHANVVIERGVTLGRNCVLYPGVFVGPDTQVGDDCTLFPNVVLYDRSVIGNRVAIHANSVIGNDGFGFATYKGAHHKIPQFGIAVIEDDVDIGAGCVIERATMGETRIGAGTKMADLISIGHGTKVGRHCLFVSLVGLSGSVEIGDYVSLAGQVGVVGHVKIGSRVVTGAQAGITNDVPDGAMVWGSPAVEMESAKRNAVVGRDLYGLAQRVRELERELDRLKRELPAPSDTI